MPPGRTSVAEPEQFVIDASAVVDLVARTPRASAVGARLRGSVWHAPAHLDAEVLSALGRLERAGKLTAGEAADSLLLRSEIPIKRHPTTPLLLGAWTLRPAVRLVDGLCAELARQLGLPLITTDQRLARVVPIVETIR
jgi:predicted nucleic acid-binding protein